MMNPRYLFRLFWAFVSRFKSVLFVSAFFGFVVFLALRVLVPSILGNQTERLAIIGRYNTSDLPFSVLSLISEGLTKVDASGLPQPALAAAWEASDNGKTWKFTLNTNKYWQDGTRVTSKNIQYSFEDVVTETPDDQTIIFKLSDSFAPFPTVVSRPTFKKGLLGTGEWKVTNLSLSGSYVDQLTLQDSEKNKKIYRFYPSEEKAKLAFKLGSIDSILDIADPKPLDTWTTVQTIEAINEKRFVAIFFNLSDQLTTDKKVRQALAYAIDKREFFGVRATSNIWPGSWAFNSQTKPYEFDQNRAKELISTSDLSSEQKKNLSIKLATTPLLLNIAEQIAEDWNNVGVKTTVQVASTIPDSYQAYLAIYDVPSDPDQYSTWHSTQQETNITHYKNPRVDTLLEQGRQELDLEKRKRIYIDFQRFLLEDSPLIILYHPYTYSIYRR